MEDLEELFGRVQTIWLLQSYQFSDRLHPQLSAVQLEGCSGNWQLAYDVLWTIVEYWRR